MKKIQKNLKCSFFSFDLYTYIVLKHLNKFKLYMIFFIFPFFMFPVCSLFVSPLCFPVVVPRCSTPGGWVQVLGPAFPLTRALAEKKSLGRSPRASRCWVEVLGPNLVIIFSLFLQCFSSMFIICSLFLQCFSSIFIVFSLFLQWFSSIFIGFSLFLQCFSSSFIGFSLFLQCFSSVFIIFHCFCNVFHQFSLVFIVFAMFFINFHWFFNGVSILNSTSSCMSCNKQIPESAYYILGQGGSVQPCFGKHN